MSNLLLSLLLCGALGAAEVQTYATRLDVAPDGNAKATASLVVKGGPLETLVLPVGFRASAMVLGEAPQGLRLEPCPGGARVTLPAAGGVCRFTFTFIAASLLAPETVAEGEKPTLPGASRLVRHAFVNTQDALVKDYSVEVALPAGYRFQGIKEQLPKAKKTEVEPRVRLGKAAGRQTAFLHTTGMKQGDAASMTLEAIPTRHSPLWLLAGLVIGALYLYYFRDSIAPEG